MCFFCVHHCCISALTVNIVVVVCFTIVFMKCGHQPVPKNKLYSFIVSSASLFWLIFMNHLYDAVNDCDKCDNDNNDDKKTWTLWKEKQLKLGGQANVTFLSSLNLYYDYYLLLALNPADVTKYVNNCNDYRLYECIVMVVELS